jgi:hypothetical protein
LADAVRAAPPDALLVDEGITSRAALVTRFEPDRDQMFGNKGGGLGFGLPATVGAAIAEADREDPRGVVGFVGDGSYLHTRTFRWSVALTAVGPSTSVEIRCWDQRVACPDESPRQSGGVTRPPRAVEASPVGHLRSTDQTVQMASMANGVTTVNSS